jgi:hypothetical protein
VESPRLLWSVVGLAVLFDAAALAWAVCLLFFPAPARPAAAPPLGGGATVVGALLAAALVVTGRALRNHHPRAGRALYAAGLIAGAALVGLAMAWAGAAPGVAGWVATGACLAAAAGLLLEASYHHGILASCGLAVLAVGWLLAGCLPVWPGVVELRAELLADGWQAARQLALLAGGATLAVAWAAANLALGLIALAPHRRSSVRTASDAAYRALALAVCLLAGCALTKGLPPRGLADVGTLAGLAGLALLLHARFADWVGDLGLAVGCGLAPAAVLVAAVAVGRTQGLADPALAGWLAWGAMANVSLAAHAAHRWYFTCPQE